MEPIRILQVVTYMGRGGLETMLMNYYRHIDRTKVQFDFLVHRDFKADYDDEIMALGGRIYHLPRLIPWSRSYHRALDAFFAAHPEYRIVHVHQDCLSAVPLRAARKAGVPVRIAHSHNKNQDKDLKYPIKLHYMKQIPDIATALFACGKEAGDWMFGGAPYQILNNAISTDLYSPNEVIRKRVREEFHIQKEQLVLGHVGRFAPQKNHVFLLRIFSAVHQLRPESLLMLVGDGEGRGKIEEKAAALGLKESVIFTGVRSDVPDLMQAMDVFVLPSLYEGLPVTMVEAQASGLPCFISDQVPAECKLTEHVKQIPLSHTPEQWAEEIIAARNTTRTDNLETIRKAGFDIRANVQWLQEYYLQRWEAAE